MIKTDHVVPQLAQQPTRERNASGKRVLARLAPDLLVLLWRLRRAPGELRERRIPSDEVIRRQFRDVVGEPLNLAEPTGLSEKLGRLKLAGATALQRQCVDKITARRYVAERVGPGILSREILTTYSLSRINPRAITEDRFVIKTNHDSGGVIVCTDRAAFDWVEARRSLADRMAFDHWRRHREPVYRGIRPGLLVEEYLEPDGPEGLREYKIFCMNGTPRFIMATRSSGGSRTKTMFDTNWEPLPVRRRRSPVGNASHVRPSRLPDLLDIAARLAEPFPFCRVDLYENFERIVFGEMTFFPEGGNDVFDPPEWERRFGDMLELPPEAPKEGRAGR